MTSFTFDKGHINGTAEFFDILKDVSNFKKRVRYSFGIVGLTASAPFMLLINTYKLRRVRKRMQAELKDLLVQFRSFDERTQMEKELELLDLREKFEQNLSPMASSVGKSNIRFKGLFLREISKAIYILAKASEEATKIVYSDHIDPATDPTLFKGLAEAYKQIDLSDWKSEDVKKRKDSLNQHAHL